MPTTINELMKAGNDPHDVKVEAIMRRMRERCAAASVIVNDAILAMMASAALKGIEDVDGLSINVTPVKDSRVLTIEMVARAMAGATGCDPDMDIFDNKSQTADLVPLWRNYVDQAKRHIAAHNVLKR